MAGADTGECDAQSLKRLLSDTALACQKCLTAVDSVVTSQQRQLAPSSVQSTTPSVNSVDIEAVEKLHRRCMQLEHQLAAERSSAEDQLSDAQQRHIDDIILKYKDRIRAIEDEKMELEAENRRLRQTSDQLTTTNTSLTQQISSLTSQLELLQRGTPTVCHDDHVQFLTEQAQQFRADFESERRDRIAAEATVAELQQQLATANAQVHQLNLQQMQDISQRRAASLEYYREQYDSSHPHGPSPPPSGRHRYTDGEDEIDGAFLPRNQDEVDSVQKQFTAANIKPPSTD